MKRTTNNKYLISLDNDTVQDITFDEVNNIIEDIKTLIKKNGIDNEGTRLFKTICDTHNREYIECEIEDNDFKIKFDIDSTITNDVLNQKPLMKDEPLTVDEMIDYVKHYGENCASYLKPFNAFSTVIDNKDYDIENFSQEIEDSEPNKMEEELKYKMEYYDPIWGWKTNTGNPFWSLSKKDAKIAKKLEDNCPKNSIKWKQNHKKQFKLTSSPASILSQAMSLMNSFKLSDENKNYTIVIITRTYATEKTFNSIKGYYKKCEDKGIKIYGIV